MLEDNISTYCGVRVRYTTQVNGERSATAGPPATPTLAAPTGSHDDRQATASEGTSMTAQIAACTRYHTFPPWGYCNKPQQPCTICGSTSHIVPRCPSFRPRTVIVDKQYVEQQLRISRVPLVRAPPPPIYSPANYPTLRLATITTTTAAAAVPRLPVQHTYSSAVSGGNSSPLTSTSPPTSAHAMPPSPPASPPADMTQVLSVLHELMDKMASMTAEMVQLRQLVAEKDHEIHRLRSLCNEGEQRRKTNNGHARIAAASEQPTHMDTSAPAGLVTLAQQQQQQAAAARAAAGHSTTNTSDRHD